MNCTVDECQRTADRVGVCWMHYWRLRTHGSTDLPPRPSKKGQNYKEVVTYSGAHQRIYKRRGRASEHTCPCGAAAEHWSYDHNDPDELTGTDKGYRVTYSVKIEHYVARCVLCHNRLDHAVAS